MGLPYHVFCLHTIWNRAEVAASLGPGATYLTILREPVELFESLWSYAGLASYYNMDLETFATSPKEGRLATRAFRCKDSLPCVLFDLIIDDVHSETWVVTRCCGTLGWARG